VAVDREFEGRGDADDAGAYDGDSHRRLSLLIAAVMNSLNI